MYTYIIKITKNIYNASIALFHFNVWVGWLCWVRWIALSPILFVI